MSGIKSMIAKQLDALLSNENNNIANMANASALLMQSMKDISWAGFYLYEKQSDELLLGPFQGKVACVHIKNGNGVCGAALKQQKTKRVKNVNEFPGHIACDSDSKSEIVIPIIKDGKRFGVLDIDSPIFNRFSIEDENTLKEFIKVFTNHLNIDKV
ncbi:GAF domain-containing protein [Apilactobacillus timberlakei]|uniref:GAF domain-containing protein n=1 Tax=Apilactobacillus timberlakei TaxID=2008380 RepID=UPI00112BFF76|nr:GAF domain-containing protein [Apilactobacillus timberlakei]TPR18516.1 GAF domain-containing protein [Apilactobacillus timberlakei]TPR20363.1 GAF domain-containing protein [Apilactobacillus timberlakei]TPR22126.1 GAF domain-containing protein [Apilactobacillus timberlakei]TPR22764.1 GAF domain-containing protein [Apilactobacillus timberlakei]